MRSRVYKHISDKYITEHCPCYGCMPPKRYGGCRSNCDAWKVYEKEYAEFRESLREQQDNDCKVFPKEHCDKAIGYYKRRIKE